MRRLLIILTAAATLLMGLVPAVGADQPDGSDATPEVVESSTGSYIVVMDEDPLIATYEKNKLTSSAAQSRAKDMRADHKKALRDAKVSEAAQVNDYTVALNGFSAVMSYDEAQEVARQKGVSLVLPDEMRYLTTDSSPGFLGVSGPGGAWARGLDGTGVVVGVIDSGIWPEHPSFADDGSYSAPPVTLEDTTDNPACDFGNSAHNANDAAFTCNNKLIGARQMLDTYRSLIGADPDEFDSARDDDGHGTHTASTTAGNSDVAASMYGNDLGTISGIAPRAHIIAYKGLGNLGGFTSDLVSAIDQAVADGVDVINYSVGGGASLLGGDDIAYLFAADAGVFVATSAGNSGPGAGTVGGPGSVPWLTTVGASTQPRFYEGRARISGGVGSFTARGASITDGVDSAPLIDAEFAGGDLCIPGTLDPDVVEGNIVLCRRGAIARAAKSLAVFEAGGVGMIMYNNDNTDNLFTDTHWVPSVHTDFGPGIQVKNYIAATANPTARILTGYETTWPSAPSMTIFSSRGPNVVAEDIIKPDITAPGMQILAGNSPFPDPGTVQGELFQAIAGTSMSSPHIAGVYALLKQAHPSWTPAMAKSAIMTTAYQDVVDNDRTTAAGPFEMGAGHVDPGRPTAKGSAFQPGLVYDAGFGEYLGFLCDAAPEAFGNPDATCAALAADGIPTDASDLNLASIAVAELPGSQTVIRTVTSVAKERSPRTYNVSVDAPDGYDVTVSPSTITLRKGESATYEVTISNVSAAIGEWEFGSLTWTDRTGNYDVYSPIAVRAALFNAPSEVTGTGTDGSASFDVSFGYTGDYSAAAHGLVARTDTSDDISQDPDQTYPSGDDGVGVDKHDFVISGAAFVRWHLAIPGDDDIDLFLEDSSGTIIASSTNGGTDETIELVLPADDTYTMVVHGWSVPNEPLAYTLESWAVSATPGGSLAIDSAPASAVLGDTGTIDVSWSGLTSGTEYLGAVSHSDAGGIIGLTLVSVSTE